jgi:predicted transcriptional regulator of viral defense system
MTKVAEIIWNDILPRTPVFTTAEVAELGDTDVSYVSRRLSKLAQDGQVTRIRRGLWAISGHPDFSPYVVVPYLFEEEDAGYVSFFTALNQHGMIEQIPQLIEVASRVNKKSLDTPFATYEFHLLQESLYGGWEPADRRWSYLLATPEKAIFDSIYISVRKGRQFTRFPELILPIDFSEEALLDWIDELGSASIRSAVDKRWNRLKDELRSE